MKSKVEQPFKARIMTGIETASFDPVAGLIRSQDGN
jgi:hypothetical protein